MKLIIDIPDGMYEAYKGRPPRLGDEGLDSICQAIANGTPLPKGHGRLIDADETLNAMDTWDKFGYTAKGELIRLTEENKDLYVPYVKFDDVCNCIDNIPTVDINTELSVAYLKGRRQGQSEERPTGEWIYIGQSQKGLKVVECTNCHKRQYGSLNYCGNCGADMRKLQTQKFADNDTASGGLASAT